MTNKKKIVVITGAGKGLGLAISQQLIEKKYHVVGIGRTKTPAFTKLSNTRSNFIEFDLLNTNKIHELVGLILKTYDQTPYGLINNAGIGLDGLLATQHNSDISKILKLNLESPIILSKYLVRQMIKNKEGRIINISSIIASTGFSGLAAYAASKSGLEGFTRSLSREIGKINITVNAIAPGYMLTDMTSNLTGPKLNSIIRRAPLGLPNPENVASTVLHLLEPLSSKTTGTVFTIDGGSTA